jgi:hypothetical protein
MQNKKPNLEAPFSFFTPPISNVIPLKTMMLKDVYEYVRRKCVKLAYCHPLPSTTDMVSVMLEHTETFRRITNFIKNAYNIFIDKAVCILSHCCFLSLGKVVFFKTGLNHFPAHLTESKANVCTAAGDITQYVSARTERETKNGITPSLDNLSENHDFQHVGSMLKKIEAGKFDITSRCKGWMRSALAFCHHSVLSFGCGVRGTHGAVGVRRRTSGVHTAREGPRGGRTRVAFGG